MWPHLLLLIRSNFTLLDNPVISAYHCVALENLGKPIVLGVLSSAVSASAGTERGSNGRDRQDDEKGRGSEMRGKWTFQKPRDTNKGSEMGHKKHQWPKLSLKLFYKSNKSGPFCTHFQEHWIIPQLMEESHKKVWSEFLVFSFK